MKRRLKIVWYIALFLPIVYIFMIFRVEHTFNALESEFKGFLNLKERSTNILMILTYTIYFVNILFYFLNKWTFKIGKKISNPALYELLYYFSLISVLIPAILSMQLYLVSRTVVLSVTMNILTIINLVLFYWGRL